MDKGDDKVEITDTKEIIDSLISRIVTLEEKEKRVFATLEKQNELLDSLISIIAR